MIRSSDWALRTVSSDERLNFVESSSPTVLAAAPAAAFSVSARPLRDVVSPCSSVTPAAEMNATAMFSSARNSTVQRPVSTRMC